MEPILNRASEETKGKTVCNICGKANVELVEYTDVDLQESEICVECRDSVLLLEDH